MSVAYYNIIGILIIIRSKRFLKIVWFVNSSPPGQNGRHIADDIFLKENVRISIPFSLKFVLKGPIDNKSALVHVMACRLVGAN